MSYIGPFPVIVKDGGTGDTTFTTDGVLVGNGTGGIAVTAAGTTGQVLTGVTSGAPTFQSPASSSISITGDSGGALTGNAFTLTGGSTGLTFAGSGTTETLGGTLGVAHGGTGDTSLTAYAVLTGGTTSTAAVQSVASVGTSGQVLTSNGAGALPTFQTTSPGTNYSVIGTAGISFSFGTSPSTIYIPPFGTGSIQPANVQSIEQFPMPVAGTFSNFYGNFGTNTQAGSTVFTIYKNSSATTMTFTVPPLTSGTFSDTTHSFTVAAGDLIQFQIVINSSVAFQALNGGISVLFNAV
jgi:hypothetical protein